MTHNITVEGGSSVRLKTAGKYCDRDIVVTAEGGGGGESTPTQEKTVDVTKNGAVEVIPDEGYTLSKATVNVDVPMPDGYIKPSGTKTIEENGEHIVTEYEKVSVNVPIPDGYIKPSGTKTIEENGEHIVTEYEKVSVNVPIPDGYIVPKGEKEITQNGTHDVTEYASVVVSVAGSTNTESEEVAALLGNTMTVLDNNLVTSLRARACQGATKLITVNLPSVTSIGGYAFYSCSGLETATLPKLTSVSTQAFYGCSKLKYADCGNLASISAQTFNACSALTELILRKTGSICTLSNVNGVNNTPIGKGTGYVYVPSSLVDSYKTATNWSGFADQFRAIEDYPEITGG